MIDWGNEQIFLSKFSPFTRQGEYVEFKPSHQRDVNNALVNVVHKTDIER